MDCWNFDHAGCDTKDTTAQRDVEALGEQVAALQAALDNQVAQAAHLEATIQAQQETIDALDSALSALSGEVKLRDIISGTTWFIAMDIVTLFILIAFPAISLFLPSLMAQ